MNLTNVVTVFICTIAFLAISSIFIKHTNFDKKAKEPYYKFIWITIPIGFFAILSGYCFNLMNKDIPSKNASIDVIEQYFVKNGTPFIIGTISSIITLILFIMFIIFMITFIKKTANDEDL